MLHKSEISGLMTAISLKLLCPTRESNQQLWTVYDLLQAWKMDVEWDHPGIGIDRSREIATIILKELCTLPDRPLAREIEHVVTHYTSPIADCGKVIDSITWPA